MDNAAPWLRPLEDPAVDQLLLADGRRAGLGGQELRRQEAEVQATAAALAEPNDPDVVQEVRELLVHQLLRPVLLERCIGRGHVERPDAVLVHLQVACQLTATVLSLGHCGFNPRRTRVQGNAISCRGCIKDTSFVDEVSLGPVV